MGIRFNADEVFELAERIERNGAAFYRGAAAKVDSDTGRRLLLELAQWEDKHWEIFSGLRRALTPADRAAITADPYEEAALYLQSLADGVIFDPKADPVAGLGLEPSMATVLVAALGREKETIVFFTGMRNLVPPGLGQARIDDIIKEEMRHVTIISKELAAVRAG